MLGRKSKRRGLLKRRISGRACVREREFGLRGARADLRRTCAGVPLRAARRLFAANGTPRWQRHDPPRALHS
eukprot:6187965-Pleurochrysis_carterae.AAC.2